MRANFKVLAEKDFDKVLEGVSIVGGDRVFVKGERTVQLEDGRIIEQYIYDIEGVKPSNNLPFAALKGNIVLT